MCDASGAIGIFDSGVGGLTVFARVAARLPDESIVYLGDTARVPYGTKSADTVIRYARASAAILLEQHVKLIVVACNTASACAVSVLRQELSVPVVGVIEPGARAAVRRSATGCIGVIGTAGTVASGAYPAVIKELAPGARVHCKACPLFVPLAEEGWTQGVVPEAAAEHYLGELVGLGIDTLVLGCTHYPLLTEVIAKTVGLDVTLVDSAEETAVTVQKTMAGLGLLVRAQHAPRRQFLVSDAPECFARIGRCFLGQELAEVAWVDF